MIKIIIGIILAILLIIFIAQNTLVVNITFLAWTISISVAILIIIMLILGVFLGFVFTEIACIRNNIKKRKKTKVHQENESIKSEKAQIKKSDKKQK
jgi:uncharacterized integral membrane protein